MSSPIDESTAWSLLRVLPSGLAGKASARVHHDSSPGVWLQVHDSGDWEISAAVTDDARVLLDLFSPLQVRSDLAIGQIGQSLDGRIATEGGHSHYVTGPADIRRLHRLRALVDAVVVGVGTVAADDPQLSVREVEGTDPVRVVLDPDGRVDRASRVFTDGRARTVVIHRSVDGEPGAPEEGDVLMLPVNDGGGFDPHAVLAALRSQGLRRVLVEGGGVTVSRFLQAGALDRLHVTVAPLLIGSGRAAFTLKPIETLSEALRPSCRHFHLGQDILFDLDLR